MTTDGARPQVDQLELPPAPAELTSRRLTPLTILKFFGPGAIIASATVGSGESILASREGAVFDYAVLWALVAAAIAKWAIVHSSNRYMILTGEHPMSRFARALPGPRGWFPALLAVICFLSFPGWASGIARALGDYLSLNIAGGPLLWAIGLLFVAAIISWVGGYAILEHVQTGIAALMVVLVIIAVVVAQPEWLQVLEGFIPGSLDYRSWVGVEYPQVAQIPVFVELAVFLGGVGGGMYDYIGYTGMMREKRWGMLGHEEIDRIADRLATNDGRDPHRIATTEENRVTARNWLRAPLIDITAAFFAVTVIGAAFVINGSRILGEAHSVPAGEDVLTPQAEFFGVIAPIFEVFYILAIVMVLFGTVYALWELYSWTAYECVSALSERVRKAGQRKMRPVVYGWTMVGAIAMLLTGANFVSLITPAAIVGGIIACGIYGAGMLYIDQITMPAELRMNGLLKAVIAIGSLFLFVAGSIALLDFWGVSL